MATDKSTPGVVRIGDDDDKHDNIYNQDDQVT